MNYYAEAINLLMSDNVDYKSICVEIAKKHPKLFLNASGTQQWAIYVKGLMLAGEKVKAIKYVREIKGIGLKEAKDLAESLI